MQLSRLSAPAQSEPLMSAFLRQRGKLRRLFALRLRSYEAAEDIIQDLAVKISEFDEAASRRVRDPGAFLYRLGCNLIIDRARARTRAALREQAFTDAWIEAAANDSCSPEAALAARRRIMAIVEALRALPDETREAFYMCRFEGRTLAAAAEAQNVTTAVVEGRLKRARRAILSVVN
jgi:RNA polymerase sigma-70 factor (ECF subfamily)